MKFNEQFNVYLNIINCSPKDFSKYSGLSEAVISRYRSGSRIPKKDSNQLSQIINSIYNISVKKNINLKKEDIQNNLYLSLNNDEFDYDLFSNKLNNLICSLNISVNDMSKFINFDASHISRIRYGKSKPSDVKEFSTKICNYILYKYNDNESKKIILTLIESDNLNNNDNSLFDWLLNNKSSKNYIDDFLNNLDNFNLDKYIKAIKFDKLKVPSIPFYKIKSKNYYGIDEMKKGEIDFFKSSILSKSKEDIFMCSDMPMEDMAKDVTFGKKWMFAIAMCLKKGLHLNIIHNLNRPFNEMMLGLESWIPIYMTGQISPYYLNDNNKGIYNHLNYVSGNTALTGECINGYHNSGKYYITTNKKEIEYYKKKCNLILKKANSLMDIYNKENSNSYKVFLLNDSKIEVDRTRYISSLPLFTISDNLLINILQRNNIDDKDINEIIKYKNNEELNIKKILNKNAITDNIYILKENEFKNDEVYLSLENIFLDKKIKYSYDEYIKHLKSTKEYSNKHKNYNIVENENRTFKNISVSILKNNYVIISKIANPNIHFVIRHKKLIEAISNFKPIVVE